MLYLIEPDGLVNWGYANVSKMVLTSPLGSIGHSILRVPLVYHTMGS